MTPLASLSDGHVGQALVLSADRISGSWIRAAVDEAFPSAACKVVTRVGAARTLLESGSIEFFLTDMEVTDGDPLDLLWLASGGSAPPRTFVVTPRCEPWLRAALRKLPVGGVVDQANDSPEILGSALREVRHGRCYRSLSLQQAQAVPSEADLRLRQLTPSERVVLAAIGDGRDTGTVADWLNLAENSVEAKLESLRGKLAVPHLGGLVALSWQYGFVRAAPRGMLRIGFGLLLSDYYLHSQRPVAPSAALRAAYPEATLLAGTQWHRARL